jgi:ADP-heptose:LPS heptosyltransferase
MKQMKPKLALIEFRMIGDAVMALPFLQSVREQYDVYVCCAPGGAEVFRMILPPEKILCWRPPWIDESSKYSPAKILKQYPGELLQQIRALKFETGVCSWADPRSSLMMVMGGIPRRIGFDLQPQNYYGQERPWRAAGLRKGQLFQRVMSTFGMPLLTETLTRDDYLQSHVKDWAQICRHLGEKWRPDFPWLTQLPSQLSDDVISFVRKHQERGPVGIIHCGARTEAKRWPPDRFKMLLERFFIPRNLPVILIDLPDLTIPDLQHPLIRTFRPGSLSSYVAISGIVDYALCNDTGSAHLSGATGKPVVTIFTNSLPSWFAPYGNHHLAVEGAPCPQKPCLERCVMPSYICRDGLTIEAVESKLLACLSELSG